MTEAEAKRRRELVEAALRRLGAGEPADPDLLGRTSWLRLVYPPGSIGAHHGQGNARFAVGCLLRGAAGGWVARTAAGEEAFPTRLEAARRIREVGAARALEHAMRVLGHLDGG